MKQSNVGSLPSRNRPLNAVALQSAVLCAECDVVSDSPHDVCMVCGSRSLVNISRLLGGNLPEKRALLVQEEMVEIRQQVVLSFPDLIKCGEGYPLRDPAFSCSRSVRCKTGWLAFLIEAQYRPDYHLLSRIGVEHRVVDRTIRPLRVKILFDEGGTLLIDGVDK